MNKLALLLLLPVGLMGQASTPTVGGLIFQALASGPPANCSASIVGTPGSTTLFYWPVANYTSGQAIVPVPITVNNAPTVLNGSNFVQINCTRQAPAISLDLLRSTTNTLSTVGTASVAVATGSTTGIFQDQGGALSSYTFNILNSQYMVMRLNDRDYVNPTLEYGFGNNPTNVTFGPLPGTMGPSYTTTFPTFPLSSVPVLAFRSDIGNLPQSATAASGNAWPVTTGQFTMDVPATAQNASSPGAAALSLYSRSATSNYPLGGVGASGGVAAGGLRIETFNSGTLGAQWAITIQTNGCDQDCSNAAANAFSQQYQIGIEADLRNHLAGSVQNTGYWTVSKSSFAATSFDGFRADSVNSANCGPGGAAAACVPWNVAFHSGNGAAGIALEADALGFGGTSLPSQPIQFRSFDAGSVTRVAAISSNINGDLQYTAANNGNNALVAHTWTKGGVGNIGSFGSVGTFTTASDNYSRLTYTARTDGVSATWPVSAFRPGIIDETTSAGGVSMTTPTAAAIVAQLKSDGAVCFVGNAFNLTIANVGGVNALGILAGASVTFQHVAASLAAGQKTVLTIIISNCTASSEAVSIIGDGVRT